jgi:HlyD family secretion protein
MRMRNIAFGLSIGLAVVLLSSCNQATEPVFQGWVEAELIFVGPDENGRIETLTVREGSPVEKGMLLLTLDGADCLRPGDCTSENLGGHAENGG